jgi:hypothetical protein
MQLHQIELVPGESIRVGHMIVTLVAVEGTIAQLHLEDTDDTDFWTDPEGYSDSELEETMLA